MKAVVMTVKLSCKSLKPELSQYSTAYLQFKAPCKSDSRWQK